MNTLLANALSALNSGVAVVLVFVGVGIGAKVSDYSAAGLLVGWVLGCLMAIFLCGFLAILLDIRNLLSRMADQDGDPSPALRAPTLHPFRNTVPASVADDTH